MIRMIWTTTCQNQQSDCAPSEDTDQPGNSPSLIRVFAVRMKKPWVLSYPLSAQRRLWSDWVDAQADLSLRWVYSHFVGFVMSQLISIVSLTKPPHDNTNKMTFEPRLSWVFAGCKGHFVGFVMRWETASDYYPGENDKVLLVVYKIYSEKKYLTAAASLLWWFWIITPC